MPERNVTGLVTNAARLSVSSGIEPAEIGCITSGMDDLLSDLTPQRRYRTPAEIRAIPNQQWETWIRGNNLPFTAFSAEAACQKTLQTIIAATLRRMKAQEGR